MVALVASLVMMTLAICVSGGTRWHRSGTLSLIDGAGVLQIVWLTNRLQVLRDTMSNVDDPTEDALRTAGMLGVDLLQELDVQP